MAKELKIIAQSHPVPSNGLCVRKDLDKSIKKKLQEALLQMDQSPEGRQILKTFGAIKFILTTAGDYKPVFTLAEKAGIDLKNYDYRNE